MSRRNIVIISVIAALALIVGLILYSLVPRASLLLSVAPESFTITINNHSQEVKTGDTITVTPGDISIQLSGDGFETNTQKLTLKNGETKEVLVALTAKTDAAKKLLETKTSQDIIQRIANVTITNTTNQLLKDYPIFSVLPLKDKFYTIESCPSKVYPDDTTKKAICINLFNLEAKQSAIDDISNHGFSIDNYEVYFVDESYDPAAQAGD